MEFEESKGNELPTRPNDTVQNWLARYYEVLDRKSGYEAVADAVSGVLDALGQSDVRGLDIQYVQWKRIQASLESIHANPQSAPTVVLTIASFLLQVSSNRRNEAVHEVSETTRRDLGLK